MKYQINDLSKILNVSPETIRYYEKKGIITPSRDPVSNYRVYDAWDVFSLLDNTLYKKFGFTTKEYEELISSNGLKTIDTIFENKVEILEKEIKLKEMILEWAKTWQSNINKISLNIGNVWFQQLPDMYFIRVGNQHSGDDVSDYVIPIEGMAQQADLMPFIIPTISTNVRKMNYTGNVTVERGGIIQKKYIDSLNYDLKGSYTFIPKQIYMVYCIDIGDIGEFDWQMLRDLIMNVKKNKYESSGDIYGQFISRTKTKDGKYSRIVEFIIPVDKID